MNTLKIMDQAICASFRWIVDLLGVNYLDAQYCWCRLIVPSLIVLLHIYTIYANIRAACLKPSVLLTSVLVGITIITFIHTFFWTYQFCSPSDFIDYINMDDEGKWMRSHYHVESSSFLLLAEIVGFTLVNLPQFIFRRRNRLATITETTKK